MLNERCSSVLFRMGLILLVVCSLAEKASYGSVGRVAADDRKQGGGQLAYGQPITGTLDDETFRQMYTFAGQAEDVIVVTMVRLDGDLDPYLLLTDERGNILALSDDGGPGVDARIDSKRLPADGRYFVIATRFGQEHGSTTGTYTLLVERIGRGTAETNTVAYGESILGRVTQAQALIFYFLRAQRGDVITISMRRTSGNLDPHLDLATADGRILISNDDDPLAEGTLDAAITHYTIFETSIYLIVATRFGREAGDTEGTFVLSVAQVPLDELGGSAEQARLVDYGATLDGTLDDTSWLRYYRFEAQRGDVITIMLSSQSGNLKPLARLLDGNLAVLAQTNSNNREETGRIAAYTIPATGMYYLLVTRDGEQGGRTSGDYTLQLTGRPGIAGGHALEITYGATVSGLIGDQIGAEEYVFLGRQGDVIRIAMQRVSGDLDPLVTLFDNERKQIAFGDDGGEDRNDALIPGFVLPRDGMYILVASRYEAGLGKTSGAYILTLELVRSAGN